MTTNTDPVRALIADWRESAADTKRYSASDHEDGYAAAESNCANRLEAALALAPPSGPAGALSAIAGQLRLAGAALPAPQVQGTPESGVITGLSIALALVESAIAQQPAAPHWGNVPELDDEQSAAPSGEAVGSDGRRERLLERRTALNNSFGNGAYEDGRVQQQIDAIDAELAALATPQQPAAPSGEAGQWVACCPALLIAGVSCARTPRREGSDGRSHEHFIAHAAPQQPAGVDEAARVLAELHPFLAGLKLAAPSEEKRAFIQERIDAVRRASAALAAQQKGGRADGFAANRQEGE